MANLTVQTQRGNLTYRVIDYYASDVGNKSDVIISMLTELNGQFRVLVYHPEYRPQSVGAYKYASTLFNGLQIIKNAISKVPNAGALVLRGMLAFLQATEIHEKLSAKSIAEGYYDHMDTNFTSPLILGSVTKMHLH